MPQSFGNNINSFNTTTTYTTVNVLNNLTVTDDRSSILTWLSPIDPKLRHQGIRDRRVESIGEWLLQTKEFRSWRAGSGGGEPDNAVLFCYGDPGVGKTYISSLVIDSLCDRARGQNVTVACFYFDFAVQKEQSSTSTLGALLKQVVGGLEKIPEEILGAYQDQKKAIGGRGPRLADIVKMLQTASSKEPTFICIDGLDECVPGDRIKLLDSLNQILQKSPGTRIFVTGRPHIRPEIGRRLSGRVTSLSISPKGDDVIRYLRSRLEEDTSPDAMDGSLEADILKKIPENISEIFLLVSLNIDAVLQETTIHRRRQKLSAMTNGLGLGNAYGATLGRIKGQGGEKSRLGMAALMWISHSERPLKAGELCHALAVEIGSLDLNTRNIPSIDTLLACCQGLVVVDEEVSTIRLIHFTLQEHLRAHPELFGTAHSTMAETCLTYLNSQQVNAFSTNLSPDLNETPFLEYSSLFWGVHARMDLSDCAKRFALKLFDDYSTHISTQILLKAEKSSTYIADFDKHPWFSGLHCASFFGIVEIVAGLVEKEGCDINQIDFWGNTPLGWAAWGGHEGVVKMLLELNGVNPDKPDKDGQTPLLCASERGHDGVVKILLGRGDVNPNRSDVLGRKSLHCAAERGSEEVMKVLFGRDGFSPNEPDKSGQTPLCLAAKNGHESVVKMLLERDDVNPNTSDALGRTPLHLAAERGHAGLVKILLGRGDVSPRELDMFGRTPLHCAAERGFEGVVKVLLGWDSFNPNEPDRSGQTPLCLAAGSGCERVVKMLLGLDGVNPRKSDKYGQTPLHCAAERGFEGVVKVLLGWDSFNPNEPNRSGQTPLCLAAGNGHEGVVKMLLGLGGLNPDKPDENGQTPLLCASERGHGGVVKILLGRCDVNPDRSDVLGRKSLHCAAERGSEEVMKVLFGRDGFNPNEPDKSGQTPLCLAARNGHESVVKMLLERDDVNPNTSDALGRTPLHLAAEKGYARVVQIILRLDDVRPNKPDILGRTPLYCATKRGFQAIVKLLRGRGGSNPDKLDKCGQTPLRMAAGSKRQGG